jgi:hypothetical protein
MKIILIAACAAIALSAAEPAKPVQTGTTAEERSALAIQTAEQQSAEITFLIDGGWQCPPAKK